MYYKRSFNQLFTISNVAYRVFRMRSVEAMDNENVLPGFLPAVDLQQILVTHVHPLLPGSFPGHGTLIYIRSLWYLQIEIHIFI